MRLEFSIYRYSPDADDAPRVQDYTLEAEEGRDMMLLGALIQLRERDPSLSFRRSCRGGVCGSDDLNMDGKNGLACITPISALNQSGRKIAIRSLPGLPTIHDLVVDMGRFYAQYEKIKLYLLNNGQNLPARERLQMPEQREKLGGLYECIPCACCSTSCLLFWWSSDKFTDPAGSLVACRLLIDNHDIEIDSRLDGLSDAFSMFCCRSIMSCISVCPKGLSPTHAIGHIESTLLQRNV